MKRSSIWTIVGVILAIVIAWWVVEALFRLMFWMAKFGAVAVVAIIVFFVLRAVFARSDSKD
ncbi:hypothetical protein [Microbacterium marinilacus]|uniref:Flagellar biosynthesis protein FlhA n=1 Tax=Microbacterium marinilacus TaxID=415209 RepID=A0ABP7BGZ9_9MICO|nr:hypothetical protein [Microbacterium marinilacus]MBY0689642.1 hypothetical protein [Microbacterium marinilacus]